MIRELEPDEIEEITRQTGHLNSAKETFNEWRELSKTGKGVVFAALDGDKPAGSANIRFDKIQEQPLIEEFGADMPIVYAVGVNDEYRRQGIAQDLMQACENYIIEHPELQQRLGLIVEKDNFVARKLYEKLGYIYRRVGGQETIKSSWEEITPDGNKETVTIDGLVMVKELE